jgi:hypothetical protein
MDFAETVGSIPGYPEAMAVLHSNPLPDLPIVTVKVRLLWHCNLACIFCRLPQPATVMSRGTARAPAAELAAQDVAKVHFSGGEVLIHPACYTIFEDWSSWESRSKGQRNMILYYALGGGLGHISRSLALMEHAPARIRGRIRMLVSSQSAAVARSLVQCPMDMVPDSVMTNRGDYLRFLDKYLAEHRFTCMVVDTFPFGLLGELASASAALPRVLVGRYLRWDAYCKRVGDLNQAIWPGAAVLIEEQAGDYLEQLQRHTRTIPAAGPVSLCFHPDTALPSPLRGESPACCIVHSGTPDEIDILRDRARRVMAGLGIAGEPKIVTPQQGIFPVERRLSGFSDVVAGAGYASCAAAAVLQGKVRYHLHPFPRRFDNQALRLRRLEEGTWGGADPAGGAARVARALWEEVGAIAQW